VFPLSYILGEGEPPPVVSSPPWWLQLLSFVETPAGIIIVGIIAGSVAAIWYTLSTIYEQNSFAIDLGATGGSAGYSYYRSKHHKHTKRKGDARR
jgi:hypothetical protein